MLGLNGYLHDTTISTFSKFIFIIQHVKYTNMYTAGLSLICLVWLIGAKILKQTMGKKIKGLKYVPEIFVLVVVATCEWACRPVSGKEILTMAMGRW